MLVTKPYSKEGQIPPLKLSSTKATPRTADNSARSAKVPATHGHDVVERLLAAGK